MNVNNLRTVVDFIEKNPKLWNQEAWITTVKVPFLFFFKKEVTGGCLAGLADKIFGLESDPNSWDNVRTNAKEVFGFNTEEVRYMFSSYRTLADFKKVLEQGYVYNPSGYNPSGYNRVGRTREQQAQFDAQNKAMFEVLDEVDAGGTGQVNNSLHEEGIPA